MIGLGVGAVVCVAAFFALLAYGLVSLAVGGDREGARWQAFAVARGWTSRRPWHLAGTHVHGSWVLSASFDHDRGTGEATCRFDDLVTTASLHVVPRAVFERSARARPAGSAARQASAVVLDLAIAAAAIASGGSGDGVGRGLGPTDPDVWCRAGRELEASAGFTERWAALTTGVTSMRRTLAPELESAWLAAAAAMEPHGITDLRFHSDAASACLQVEGVPERAPLDLLDRIVRLGTCCVDHAATRPS